MSNRRNKGNDLNGRFCRECANLPHRREKPFCWHCLEPFVEEPIPEREPEQGLSSLALFDSW